MLTAAYETLPMLPLAFLSLRVRDGVATTPVLPGRWTNVAQSTTDWQPSSGDCVRDGRKKRRELEELRVWLQITAKPFG